MEDKNAQNDTYPNSNIPIEHRILAYLSNKKMATANRIMKDLRVDKRYVVKKLRDLVLNGNIGMIITMEKIYGTDNYRKVIYYVSRENFNEVVKWLKSNSNILVKMKLLLPENFLNLFPDLKK